MAGRRAATWFNQDYGITIVVITHEMSVVKAICSKVAVLNQGYLVEQGTVEDVFTAPKSAEARKLILHEEDGGQ